MSAKAKCAEYLFFGFPIMFYVGALYGIISQIVAFSNDNSSKLRDYASIIDSINDNIKLQPFYDVVVGDSGGHSLSDLSCPSSYQLYSYGRWGGTSSGCYNSDNHTLMHYSCAYNNINATQNEYRNIPPYSSAPLIKWENIYFCVRRISNYYTLNATAQSCQDDYTLCNQKYCVLKPYGCFITSMKIEHIPGQDITHVQISKKLDELAIVSLGIEVGGMPCQDPSYSPRTPVYPLGLGSHNGCDQYGTDSKAIVLDEAIEYDTLLANGLSNVVALLPFYASYTKTINTYLYYTKQLEFSLEENCQQVNFTWLADKVQNYSVTTMSMMDLVAYSILGLIFVGSTVIFLCVDKEEADRERFERDQKCLFHTFHWMPYVMGILFIIEANTIPRQEKVELGPIIPIVQKLVSNNCLHQPIYQTIFQDLQELLVNTTHQSYLPTKQMEIFSWTCIAMLLLIRGFRAYNRREVEIFEANYLEIHYHQQNLSRANNQAENANEYEAYDDYESEGS